MGVSSQKKPGPPERDMKLKAAAASGSIKGAPQAGPVKGGVAQRGSFKSAAYQGSINRTDSLVDHQFVDTLKS